MNFKEINEEVMYTTDAITKIDSGQIEQLKNKAADNARKRVRLCCHKDIEDTLHEMLIVHVAGAYVRPHKHIAKSESFHIIEGELKVVIFNNEGGIREVVKMNDSGSGKIFYYRLSADYFHTVIPVSNFVVFHETTNGPFKREDTVFAPWTPAEGDTERQTAYLHDLEEKIKG